MALNLLARLLNVIALPRAVPAAAVPDAGSAVPVQLFDDEMTALLRAAEREAVAASFEQVQYEVARLIQHRVGVQSVEVDVERGTAEVVFAERSVLRLATDDVEIQQLAAATRLVTPRLGLHYAVPESAEQQFVFQAAHWTIYVTARTATLEM